MRNNLRAINFLVLVVCISALFACKEEIVKEVIEVPALRASHIYNRDSVYFYLGKYQDKHKSTADYYLDKARETEEVNPKKAVYYLKRSLTLYPNKETYEKLAKLLVDNGMDEEAMNAYGVIVYKGSLGKNYNDAVYLFDKPGIELFYENLAARIRNNQWYADEFWEAEEEGFSKEKLKEMFLADTRFKFDTSDVEYKNVLFHFMSEDEIEAFRKSPTAFADLLRSIKDTSSVYEINLKKVGDFKYNREFDEMDGTVKAADIFVHFTKEMQENSDGWVNCNFNHKISISDTVVAVIYSVDTSASACPKDMRHIYHQLTTYNKQGRVIDSKVVAVQSADILNTVKFNREKFTISQYARKWERPYEKDNFDNNVVNTEFKGTEEYFINPSGKIEKAVIAEQPAAEAI